MRINTFLILLSLIILLRLIIFINEIGEFIVVFFQKQNKKYNNIIFDEHLIFNR